VTVDERRYKKDQVSILQIVEQRKVGYVSGEKK